MSLNRETLMSARLKLLAPLLGALLLSGCQTFTEGGAPGDAASAPVSAEKPAKAAASRFPCLDAPRFDLMFDIGPSIAVGDEEKLDLARNAAERLLEDLAEYDHPVAIFTASPYAIPGGDETPRPAALARVIDGLKALPRNNPKLERAISAYAATYGCAPKTRGALVLFTDGAWLDDQKVLRAAERLTRLAPSAGLFVVGLRPNESDKANLLRLVKLVCEARGEAGGAYIEVDRLEYDPDAFLLFSDKLHRWLADDTEASAPEEEETAV